MRLVIVVVLLLLASLRPLQAATPCVPVEVEAPLRLPRPSAKTTTPGCVDYRRVPRSAGGERAPGRLAASVRDAGVPDELVAVVSQRDRWSYPEAVRV